MLSPGNSQKIHCDGICFFGRSSTYIASSWDMNPPQMTPVYTFLSIYLPIVIREGKPCGLNIISGTMPESVKGRSSDGHS